MRVLMIPHMDPEEAASGTSGIHRVIRAYQEHLPKFGVQFVAPGDSFDVRAVHAGMANDCEVAHCHGLYWTGDFAADNWQMKANADVIYTLRGARAITVPSEWVAETLRRDMRVNPHVVGHGIDWEVWQSEAENQGYVLWNKNRMWDVCDPAPVSILAKRFPGVQFMATFQSTSYPPLKNVHITGILPFDRMKQVIQSAAVYLSTTKETFGIGTLEAMASGVPVLGFAHGGNLETVRHGVTGYLARPGDTDDLAEGLDYCLQHRQVLGGNARIVAKDWTWDRAARLVAEIYAKAMVADPPTVAVVIPTYNYASKVGRAIQSALDQTRGPDEVIVVDDGSTDETEKVVRAFVDPRVRYVRQDNTGVAGARNRGVYLSSAKYVCCLDADDAIAPRFLEACVPALEQDRRLGIAYTGLLMVRGDGSTTPSAWPGEFNYDDQLRRKNQVPTCCVFRKEAWNRLGGYRQRYAPDGAGSEDADFWTRIGAAGWGAKKVTDAPLFHYSLGGRVSGSADYHEVDWLAWHPWVNDRRHPFASVARPARLSHGVRQYDRPLVSVVIPVGPKHTGIVVDALDSLEAQTFRYWEAVVAWDAPGGIDPVLLRAYPYVRWLATGGKGAGYARNRGAEVARAPFIVFLDADDWLMPTALSEMLAEWNNCQAIIYTDYVGWATVEDPSKLAISLQRRLHKWNGKVAEIGHRSAPFDQKRAAAQPETEPYVWCNVTCLIPRAWHAEVGGFDEKMASWEDVDYHWRLARAGRCYAMVARELLTYRFYTGSRREAGLQAWSSLVEYLRKKYEEIPIVPSGGCNCGGNRGRSIAPSLPRRKEAPVSDDDFVMIKYMHPNVGDHPVVGSQTKTKYGYRKQGDVFLVDRRDAEADPGLFVPVEAAQWAPERAVVAPPPAPEPKPLPPVGTPPAPSPAPGGDALDLELLPKTVAKHLGRAGIVSKAEVLGMGVEGLMGYKGVTEVMAKKVIDLLQGAPP